MSRPAAFSRYVKPQVALKEMPQSVLSLQHPVSACKADDTAAAPRIRNIHTEMPERVLVIVNVSTNESARAGTNTSRRSACRREGWRIRVRLSSSQPDQTNHRMHCPPSVLRRRCRTSSGNPASRFIRVDVQRMKASSPQCRHPDQQ